MHQGLFTLGGFERFSHGIAEHNFFLLVQAVDSNTLISLVLSADRQAYSAVLAINAHELGFNFVTNRQHQSGVFYAVTSSVGGTQVAFYAVSQFDHGTLGINLGNLTLHNSTFLVVRQVLIERVFFDLLDAQGDALALRVHLQNNGFDLVALLEFTHGFFAWLFQEMSDR